MVNVSWMFTPEVWVDESHQHRWLASQSLNLSPTEQLSAFRAEFLREHPFSELKVEAIDPIVEYLFTCSPDDLRKIAAALSLLPWAGSLSNTIDGRLLVAGREVLGVDGLKALDTLAATGSTNLSFSSRSVPKALIQGGIATMVSVISWDLPLQSRFLMRFSSEELRASPATSNIDYQNIGELCRTLMKQPTFSAS